MSTKGDLAGYLVSKKGLSFKEASEIVSLVLEAADDPNFATRFAKDYGLDDGGASYWDVIEFLQNAG